MKRFLSVLLALVLTLGLLPAQAATLTQNEAAATETPLGEEAVALEAEPEASAAEESEQEENAELLEVYSGTCGDDLTWTLDTETGVLSISGTGTMTDYSYSSAPWYSYRSVITSARIGSGVTSIGDYAFSNCAGLTSVTIPDGVTSIGDYAFQGCTGLTEINVAASNPSYCSADGVLFNKEMTRLIQHPAGKAGAYTIPDSVTSIGAYAFSGCTGLISVTIPDSVTSIALSAFGGCTNLTEINVAVSNPIYCSADGVLFNKEMTELIQYPAGKAGAYTIPDGVTSIGEGMFFGCTSLTSISIPDSVTSIGNFTFENCTNLTCVTIPDSVTSIGYFAFTGCTSLTSIAIPSNMTSIGRAVFYGCTGLTSVTLPDSVTSIDRQAFEFCASLANVTIPSSVTSIGTQAFYGCTSLTSIAIPDGVTDIGDFTFKNCTSLTSIVIPASVTSIGTEAFCKCTYLSDVYYGGNESEWNAITIGAYYTGDDPLTTATIHYNCTPHTVTFDSNGGTVDLSGKTVFNNMPYGMLPVPSRSGYVFDGWYTAVSGGALVQGADTVSLTADQTLYAHWTSQTVQLPVVMTNAATGIGTKSATLSGTVQESGDSAIISRHIVYWSKDNTAKRYTVSVGEDFSKTLTGLTPSTTYFFYAKATNSSGEGTGDVRSFTTNEEPQPTSISVSPTRLSLDSGDVYQLVATVLPTTAQDRSVVWASSDQSVATVDGSGNVTAVGGGSTTITATTSANGLTASCAVDVAAREDLTGSFDFSEWHMASASSSANTTDGYDFELGDGGNATMATAYLARWGGAVLEENDPYRAYGDGVYNSALSSDYHVQEAIWLPARTGSNDNSEFKAAVMNYGAAYVSFEVNRECFSDNFKNYYLPDSVTHVEGGHAVAIVGWDDNYSASNFATTPPGNGAFICKNSWGTYSGEDGYFYISYYDKSLGTDGGAVFPEIETNTNYNTIYQYDPLGTCSALYYSGSTAFYGANVFPQAGSTLQQSETLRAVSFYTRSKNTSYEVYIITNYKNMSSLYARGTAAASGTIQEMGYHTVNLDKPITLAAGTRFAVIVKLSVTSGSAYMSIEYPLYGYSSKARANAAESYYSPDGTSWKDLTSSVKNANFCIKAFTDNGSASYSAQLFEAIDNETRAYESDVVYTPGEAVQLGVSINPAYLQWYAEQEEKQETAELASAEDTTSSLGAVPSPMALGGNSISFVTGTYLPTRYDLREENCVTGVRDQGNWGNCWTFASYASLESCLLKKTKSVTVSLNAGNALDTLAGIAQGNTSTSGTTNIADVQIVNGELTATISLADSDAGAAAFFAAYSQGRMTDVQQTALASGSQSVSFSIPANADSVKLFVLSDDSTPLCEAYQAVP